jgi:hypothetical protein
MPTSLMVSFVILSIFFCFSTCLALRDKLRGRPFRYRKIGRSQRHSHSKILRDSHNNRSGPPTYQDASDYVLPPKQNVVTYCMIDKRLLDTD